MSEKTLQNLITIAQPRSAVSEAYRTLLTSIDFAGLDRPIRTLMLTSASPEEGKSSTLANLAVVAAQEGRKVIVVDCDLRRPSLHSIFGLPNSEGLTTALMNAETLREPPLRSMGVNGLSVLTSGPIPPNPLELLGSRRMADLLAALAERADMVLVDAPPVVAVADAAILASKVDAVLLVVQAGKAKRDYVERAKTLLEKANARIIGAALTNVQADSLLTRYYAAEGSR
ncbi:MAG: CpsD/CapB family tyrosine-protein kinase [Anaerolineae bacterium]